MVIVGSILLMGILGLASGTFLAFAAKKFEVKEDPAVKEIIDALPGVNCGACGYPGCEAFGKAVAKGEVKPDGCIPGKRTGVPEKIREIQKKHGKG